MSKGVIVAAVVALALSLVGCQEPRWVSSGPYAYGERQPGALLFRGYSGVCGSPQDAAARAHAAAAREATHFAFQGVQVESFFAAELQKEPDFARIKDMLRLAVTESAFKTFSDHEYLADTYVDKRRDRLEVTFHTHYLYQISRPRFAEVLRQAKDSLELRILKEGPGSTPELRRTIAERASAVLDSMADEIMRSW